MLSKEERLATRRALDAKDAEVANAAIKDKAYFAELRDNLRAAGCAFSYEVGADNWNKSYMWVFGYSGEWRKFFDAKDAEIARLREALILYVEEFGGIHDEECPQDDTCECHRVQLTNAMTIAKELRESVLRAHQMSDDLNNLATRCEGLVSLEDALAAFRLTMADHQGEGLNPFNGGVMEVEFVDRLTKKGVPQR